MSKAQGSCSGDDNRMSRNESELLLNPDYTHNPTAKLGIGGLQLFHVKRIGSGLGVDVGEVRIVLVYD